MLISYVIAEVGGKVCRLCQCWRVPNVRVRLCGSFAVGVGSACVWSYTEIGERGLWAVGALMVVWVHWLG